MNVAAQRPETALDAVVHEVLRRARQQEYLVSREIRAELVRANLPESLWTNVVEQAGDALRHERNRYYYLSPVAARLRLRVREEQQQRREVQRSVGALIRQRRAAVRVEHREEGRVPLVRPVTARREDGREHHFLSQDISPSGIQLIGNCSLVGQKIQLTFVDLPEQTSFVVSILWAQPVGDGLIRQGGIFLRELQKNAGDSAT